MAVEAERAVLAGLEGGCQVPVGVWARDRRSELVVEACVLAADGSESLRVRRSGPRADAPRLARQVAAALLDRGAERLLRAGGDTALDERMTPVRWRGGAS